MTTASSQQRSASPFGKGAVLGILVVGFAAFVSMLYFIGVGDTGGDSSNRSAHASADGLHGYSGLAQLLEANGYDVEKSRLASGLDTSNLLVITPPFAADAEDIDQLLDDRQYAGPTLIILPKWFVGRPTGDIAEKDEDKVRDDWVQLYSTGSPGWIDELSGPYTLTYGQPGEGQAQEGADPVTKRWGGLQLSGELPDDRFVYAEKDPDHEAFVVDESGRTLALNVIGQEGTYYYDNAHWVTIVVEPDLMNNYGLSDPARAALTLKIVEQAGYEDKAVTFDLTLVGIGGSTNLLTLAFQPPFLAATLCLILAMLIVGWRAFLRFGPVAAGAREASFGKSQLVKNGAGLIVRARRLGLLAAPYIALNQRKLGQALGLTKPDAQSIDAALKQRLPDEEPFSNRVAKLQNATRAGEVVRAAQHLNELAIKTMGKS